jgi:hypothetical protein
VFDVGQVPAVGEHRQLAVGQALHRGVGLLDGQQVVPVAPDDQGRRGEGGEPVEQDLTLPVRPEQGAGHRGGGLELARPAAERVLLGEELGRDPPGLCEQHGRGHGGAGQVAAGHAADHDGQLADDRQGVQRQQRVHLAAQARAVDQGQRPDAGRVGQREPQRDRAARGVSDHVERFLSADGGQERGHEGGQVGAGSVTGGNGAAVAVTGQARRQDPVGPGEGGHDPPPAGRALLVPVQEKQQRPGAGLQILGFHPVDRDPAIMNNDLPPGPGGDRCRRGLRKGGQ